MRRIASLFILSVFFMLIPGIAPAKKEISQSYSEFYSAPLAKNQVGVMTLGIHSNILVRVGDRTVLFDPSTLMKPDLEALKTHGVDLVVYTHGHGDHYDKGTALKIFQSCRPTVAVDPSLASDLKKEIPPDKLIAAASGGSYSVGDIAIDTLEGKHIGPIMLFRISINGIRVFHGGDSAYVDLSALASDVSFVPTGSPSPTCKPTYALKMVSDTRPRITLPMHGSGSEHLEFMTLVEKELPGVRVVVPEPYVVEKLTIDQ